MDWPLLLAVALIGLLAGYYINWLQLRGKIEAAVQRSKASVEAELASSKTKVEEKLTRIAALEQEVTSLRHGLSKSEKLNSDLTARMEEERKNSTEKLELLEQAKINLLDAFKSLSGEALKSNNKAFIELASQTLSKFQEAAKSDLEERRKGIESLVKPLGETLAEMEKLRTSAYAGLCEQIRSMSEAQDDLKKETSRLVQALRKPIVRGRWGEIQLKRVVELAGMLPYCDFIEQESISTEDGRLRPDLVIKLPGGKNVVVDAKAPLEGYLNAIETPDEETRHRYLDNHARQIKGHIQALAGKSYWEQFKPTPEFVILFLPGEPFFSAALEKNPTLIEDAVSNRVLLATPISLIALLKSVAYGWKQETIAASAEKISTLGRELHGRMSVLVDHLSKVGKELGSAVAAYNSAVGSFESRVLVSARKFQDYGATGGKEIPILSPLDGTPRLLNELPESAAASDIQADNPPAEDGAEA
jgi:DNA recombination protein RmuC